MKTKTKYSEPIQYMYVGTHLYMQIHTYVSR